MFRVYEKKSNAGGEYGGYIQNFHRYSTKISIFRLWEADSRPLKGITLTTVYKLTKSVVQNQLTGIA